MIYEHCLEDGLKPHSNLMFIADSKKLERNIIQKALRDLKIAEVTYKQEKKLLAFKLSKVQQESFTAAFQEEERKIRLDGQDTVALKTLLLILRSLSIEQLEELHPDVELQSDFNSNHCAGQTLALGNFVISDISFFSEFIMNNQENEEMDTTRVLDDTTSVLDDTTGALDDTSGVLDDTTGVLDDTTGVLDDIQLDDIICDLSNQDLLQDTPQAHL
jgi:hypothetical protein